MNAEGELRVAITYHYSLALGGSERVLEALAGMFPKADFFALIVDPKFLPEALRGRNITTSFLDGIPGAKRVYPLMLPLYPLAVEGLDLSGYDLVISADGAATKGVLTDQHAIHLCYCHSPARSYWDQYASTRRRLPWPARLLFAPVAQFLRQWDFAAAQRIDGFIANSKYVAERIRKYYRRESTVIYPPVETSAAWLAKRQEDFYLSVGRLVAAKRVDLAIEACNRLGRRLRIVGTGPEMAPLRTMAGPTIEFLGRVDEDELKRQYSLCRALVFPADEDFGLVAVEAQAFGRPVIALGRGGSLETVRGVWADEADRHSECTGIFFREPTAESLLEAMLRFERVEHSFDPVAIREHARHFDTAVFVAEIQTYVGQWMSERRSSAALRERKLGAPIGGNLALPTVSSTALRFPPR